MVFVGALALLASALSLPPLTTTSLSAGLRTDGLGALIGGIFNTFPYTSFAQNIGLVSLTGVRSRFVCVAGGFILVLLGFLPKLAALMEALPQFVLGGAGVVMFGMVIASGIRMLSVVDFGNNKNNLYIVAVSLAVGMVPMVAPDWTQHMLPALRPLLESSILLTAAAAVALNIFFNGANAKAADVVLAVQVGSHHV